MKTITNMDTIIKNAPFGFAHHEIIVSDNGDPVDYRFLEINRTFEKLTGLSGENILGKTFSEALPEMRDDVFDRIPYYGKIALGGGSNTFQHYSEFVKKWYLVQVYSAEKYYFTTIFTEITANKIICETASRFQGFSHKNIDYNYLAEKARILSGAKFAVFNQFDENGKTFTTMGVSGMNRHMRKAINMLGFDFRKKKWPYDPNREKLISHKQITYFFHLKELAGTVISSRVIDLLCRTFGIRSAVVVKSDNDGRTIGDYTLLFATDTTVRHLDLLELYTNLTGMLIARIEAEKRFFQEHERLSLSMDVGEQGFWDWNLETGDVFFSPRYYSMLGYENQELPMRIETFSSLLHPEDRKNLLPVIQKHVKKGEAYQIEIRMRCKSGAYKWISAQGKSFLKNEKDIPFRAVGLHVDIDQRKKNQERIRHLSRIVEQAGDAIIETDTDLKITYMNRAAEEQTGYSLKEAKGKNVQMLSARPKDKQNTAFLNSPLETTLKEQRYFNKRKNGEEYITSAIISPIFDSKNNHLGYVSFQRDITEQITVRKQMKAQKEQFELAIKGTNDGIFDWNIATGELFLSQRWKEMLGYNDHELENNFNTFISLIHPNDKERVNNYIQYYLEGKTKHYSIEFRMIHKNGSSRWILAKGKALRDEKGIPYRMAGSHSDITRQKKTELELRDSKEKLSKIGDAALDAVIMVNEKGKVKYFNKAATRIFGYSEQEIMGKDVNYMLMPEKYQKAYEVSWEKFKKKGEGPAIGKIIEMEAKTANEILIPIEIAISPITIKNKIWALAYIRDIFQRKKTEEELVRAKDAAEKANRAKSEFLANMSHEIRTPMNSILGFSEIMLNTTGDPKQKDYLKTILDSGKTLLSLINDILDLSKIESGRLEVSPEPTNLRAIIKEMEQLFHQKAEEKNLDFIIEIDDNLPPALLLDEVRLEQIMLNLIGNAIKFTPEGFVKTEITILSRQKESIDFEIAVSDSGIGIPQKDHQYIFESFSQQSGQSIRQYGGTGLGLAISKRLVELMNGSIRVESSPGKGSRFTITFPEIRYSDEITEKEDTYVWNEENIIFDAAKILIVDDISQNRNLVVTYLEKFNLTLFEAENGEMAVSMANAYLPDMILMDIRMPGINGYEATQMIKSADKTAHIPVVALTASTMKSEINKINQLFNGYLRKPIHKKLLINELLKHLSFKEKHSIPLYPGESKPMSVPANAPIAPEMKKIFKITFEEEIKSQSSMMVIDQLFSIADRLDHFAGEHQIHGLKEKTADLRNHLEAFEIEGIQKKLKQIIEMFN
jgi:PAS domain S-box-containing protein